MNFNRLLGPNLQYVHDDKVKHKDLLELNDLWLLEIFHQNEDMCDEVKIKCLSNNEATSWLDVVPNNHYGVNITIKKCCCYYRHFLCAAPLMLINCVINVARDE